MLMLKVGYKGVLLCKHSKRKAANDFESPASVAKVLRGIYEEIASPGVD